jgi:hypothetical protein
MDPESDEGTSPVDLRSRKEIVVAKRGSMVMSTWAPSSAT